MSLFGQTPLRNSIAMATPMVPGDQKLFEKVCYMLYVKIGLSNMTLSRRRGGRTVEIQADSIPFEWTFSCLPPRLA